MVFEFILSHSGWRYAQICFSETFVALVSGLQGALWELGAAGGGQERQPVCCDAQAEGRQGPASTSATRRYSTTTD